MVWVTLQQALALHQAGRLTEAEAGYRQALAEQPGNPDALHFLGVVAHQSGRHEDAIDLIQQAIAIRQRPAFFYNLAHVHLARQDAAAAEEGFSAGDCGGARSRGSIVPPGQPAEGAR